MKERVYKEDLEEGNSVFRGGGSRKEL